MLRRTEGAAAFGLRLGLSGAAAGGGWREWPGAAWVAGTDGLAWPGGARGARLRPVISEVVFEAAAG